MRGIPFTKMHGLGNDFVIVDGRTGGRTFSAAQIRAIADRRCGVGCDQFITLEPSTVADVFMRIHNPDGTEAEACGNATRCVAQLLAPAQPTMTVETVGGRVLDCRNGTDDVTVDMGPPRFHWREIPLASALDTMAVTVAAADRLDRALPAGVAVNMANPHIVFFVDDVEDWPLETIGPMVEHDPLFPERVNVSLAGLTGPAVLRLRVWERGAGRTLACGSAACATLVAAARRGLIERHAAIVLDGGTLQMTWAADDHVMMRGPTTTSFRGELAAALMGGS